MVASKKKRAHDPSVALYGLLSAHGSSDDIWDDLLGSIEDDPIKRISRALAGAPKYDDRAAALVFTAMLEHSLEIAISSVFISKSNRVEKLFSYRDQGPLSTFKSKAKIADALGLYDDKMYADIEMLILIRNVFAHARVHVDFKHDAIVAACQALSVVPNITNRLDVGHRGRSQSPRILDSRQQFTAAIAVMTNYFGLFPVRPVSDAAIQQNYALMYRSSITLPQTR